MLTGILFALVAVAVRQAMTTPRRTHEPEPPDPVARLPIYEGLASAPENVPIKLVGRVRTGSTSLATALGGEPCVAYVVGATVWHSRKVPQVVANLHDGTAAPFTLVLADSEVEVGEASFVDCATRKVARHPERERAVLARHKLERHVDSTDFTEGRIVDGDRVTVVGQLVRDHGGERGYRDHVARLRVAGTTERPLAIVKAKK